MELAVILVLLVIVELVVSVWMLARHKLYLREIGTMRDELDQAQLFYSSLAAGKDDTSAGYAPDAERVSGTSVADLVSQASAEDLAQAQQLLTALGVKVANDGRD